MEHYEEVLKLLHDQFDWKLTDSLTTTGKKLVADTIKVLKIVEEYQALQLQQTGVSGSYNWHNAFEKKPITYLSGEFDGKDSDDVLVKCDDGTFKVAKYNNGYMDGSNFECWYDSNTTYELTDVILWIPIRE